MTIPCLCIVTAKTTREEENTWNNNTDVTVSLLLRLHATGCSLTPKPGVTSAPRIWRPLWSLSGLPGVTQGGLCPVSGGTKQYERFRDTIFLNYWAIVFVQDVVFLISFDRYFNVFFVIFFLFFVKMVCLCLFFSL